MINAEIFAESFLGYNIVDCVIRNKGLFYFLVREDYTMWLDSEEDDGDLNPDDTELEKRVISYTPSDPKDDQWGQVTLTGWRRSCVGLSVLPKEQLVVASIDGDIFAAGSGEFGQEKQLPRNKKSRRGGVRRLKTIDNRLYIVGGNRTVGFREGKNRWKWLTCDVPYPKEGYAHGFEDVDGFSHDDLYAVGGAASLLG